MNATNARSRLAAIVDDIRTHGDRPECWGDDEVIAVIEASIDGGSIYNTLNRSGGGEAIFITDSEVWYLMNNTAGPRGQWDTSNFYAGEARAIAYRMPAPAALLRELRALRGAVMEVAA